MALMGLFRLDYGAYGVVGGVAATLLGRANVPPRRRVLELLAFLTGGAVPSGFWLVCPSLHEAVLENLRFSLAFAAGASRGLALSLPLENRE